MLFHIFVAFYPDFSFVLLYILNHSKVNFWKECFPSSDTEVIHFNTRDWLLFTIPFSQSVESLDSDLTAPIHGKKVRKRKRKKKGRNRRYEGTRKEDVDERLDGTRIDQRERARIVEWNDWKSRGSLIGLRADGSVVAIHALGLYARRARG